MTNEKALSPSPAMKIMPKIVENQCGCIDISQSMTAKVIVMP